MDRGAWQATVRGVRKSCLQSDMTEKHTKQSPACHLLKYTFFFCQGSWLSPSSQFNTSLGELVFTKGLVMCG